jgi:transposase
MRKIRALSQETIKLLKRIESTSYCYKARQRALCIRLSYKNYTIKELSNFFQVTYLTIQRWLDRWDEKSFPGLYDNTKGRGRKPTFDGEQESQIKDWVKETPKQLENVQVKIEEAWGIKTSKYTIKRIIKKKNMSWHRMRKTVGGEPEKADYEKKTAELEELKKTRQTRTD